LPPLRNSGGLSQQRHTAGSKFFLALAPEAQAVEVHPWADRFVLEIAVPGFEGGSGVEHAPAPAIENFKRDKIVHSERIADPEAVVSAGRSSWRKSVGNKNLRAVERIRVYYFYKYPVFAQAFALMFKD
jgi:hypothetical protein